MDISALPPHPLSMDFVHDLQESAYCTPLFFLPDADSENDIIVIATTEAGVHSHIAFDSDSEAWSEVGRVRVGDSLDESNEMAFSLFGELADWIDERYDRDDVAILDEQSANQ